MHPAVVKASRVGGIAKKHGWHGSIEHEKALRETVLTADRNGNEKVQIIWRDNQMVNARYWLLDKEIPLHCVAQVMDRIEDWPDVIKAFKQFPEISRIELVNKLRRLPFDWENDSNETILRAVAGRKLFWYNRIDGKVQSDVVTNRSNKKYKMEIKEIGHRKMLNFIGVDVGFRSVMLDSILKVG